MEVVYTQMSSMRRRRCIDNKFDCACCRKATTYNPDVGMRKCFVLLNGLIEQTELTAAAAAAGAHHGRSIEARLVSFIHLTLVFCRRTNTTHSIRESGVDMSAQ